ncbi:YybH family protein [Sphingopyxis sp.]|jgi:ketosteroid isomerase-like protein|uniref:YybH family protein n=1 Tax=Sphingopyxis sp. TaxID=1908224 RepID=UPI002DE6A1FA|nr:DUF4440 domain-containing protein [Sphingopyxis sp.]
MTEHAIAQAPKELGPLISKAVEAGDIATALAFYEPGAAMILSSGEATTDREGVRAELQALADIKPKAIFDEVVTVMHGDGHLATTRCRGRILATGPDGSAVTLPFHTLEVSRKQPDGAWLVAIDNPYIGSMDDGGFAEILPHRGDEAAGSGPTA